MSTTETTATTAAITASSFWSVAPPTSESPALPMSLSMSMSMSMHDLSDVWSPTLSSDDQWQPQSPTQVLPPAHPTNYLTNPDAIAPHTLWGHPSYGSDGGSSVDAHQGLSIQQPHQRKPFYGAYGDSNGGVSPPMGSPTRRLPAYEALIAEAITTLDNPDGVAPRAIFSWMQENYPDLPRGFRGSATQALKKAMHKKRFLRTKRSGYINNPAYDAKPVYGRFKRGGLVSLPISATPGLAAAHERSGSASSEATSTSTIAGPQSELGGHVCTCRQARAADARATPHLSPYVITAQPSPLLMMPQPTAQTTLPWPYSSALDHSWDSVNHSLSLIDMTATPEIAYPQLSAPTFGAMSAAHPSAHPLAYPHHEPLPLAAEHNAWASGMVTPLTMSSPYAAAAPLVDRGPLASLETFQVAQTAPYLHPMALSPPMVQYTPQVYYLSSPLPYQYLPPHLTALPLSPPAQTAPPNTAAQPQVDTELHPTVISLASLVHGGERSQSDSDNFDGLDTTSNL